jgi:Calcium binding
VPPKAKVSGRRKAKLERLIAEAVLDAYNPAEQATGFYTMMADNVGFPFSAKAVGEDVEVTGVDLDDYGEGLVALCRRKGRTYRIQLTEVELPRSFPGRDWIAAYFQFCGKQLG